MSSIDPRLPSEQIAEHADVLRRMVQAIATMDLLAGKAANATQPTRTGRGFNDTSSAGRRVRPWDTAHPSH